MADILTKPQRGALMGRIRGAHTRPELAVRSFLHRHGFRFKLHSSSLPGRPDVVLPKLRTAIFVHGCFWHRHQDCVKTTTPSTRRAFWQAKFKANMERDKRNVAELEEKGWTAIIIWECEVTPVRLAHLVLRLKKRAHRLRALKRRPAAK